MFLSVVTFYFWLLTVIAFSKHGQTTCTKCLVAALKEARYRFFSDGLRVLKTKIRSEGKRRFLPYYTIMMTYDDRFILHWFPSNIGCHSNDFGIQLVLKKADFLEIDLVRNIRLHYNILTYGSWPPVDKVPWKSVTRFWNKTRMIFLRTMLCIAQDLHENLSIITDRIFVFKTLTPALKKLYRAKLIRATIGTANR